METSKCYKCAKDPKNRKGENTVEWIRDDREKKNRKFNLRDGGRLSEIKKEAKYY